MAQHGTPTPRSADPWAALGRLVAGVALYGALGWVGDHWLGTSFLLPLGIVFGTALGLVLSGRTLRND